MNHQQRTKSAQRSKRRANPRSPARRAVTNRERIPRAAPATQPLHKMIRLRVVTVGNILSAGNSSIIKRWNPNSAYQPEVGGGTAATPGYSDWAQLYGYYRVVGYRYRFTCSNNEAFPIAVYCIESNSDMGTTTNSTIASNRNTFVKQLAAKGGMDTFTHYSKYYPITSIVGDNSPLTDDTYRGLVAGSPADVTWTGIGCQSAGGANLPNGMTITFELEQYTDFYDPLPQI